MKALTLLEQLATAEYLDLAWKNIDKSNPESYGLSGLKIRHFKENKDLYLRQMAEQLKKGTFRFSPTRAYLIPKDKGGFRPLQIPEITDRVVLKGLAMLLEEYLQHRLSDSYGVSFAYQKRLGIAEALQAIKFHYNNGDTVVYEADIIDFFGTVKREELLADILPELPDKSIDVLVKEGLAQAVGNIASIPVDEQAKFIDKGGIPQGNALSPLLSNLYLATFDKEMVKRHHHLVRYADDFVVMCKSHQSAMEAYLFTKKILREQLSLEVHELSDAPDSKTQIKDPVTQEFSFLSITFDGVDLFPSEKNKNKFLGKIKEICLSSKWSVLEGLQKIQSSLDGWISNYLFTSEERYFKEIDLFIDRHLLLFLNRKNWRLKQSDLGKVSFKTRERKNGQLDSGQCISQKQRKSSGIDLCMTIFKKRTESKKRTANIS